MSHVYDIITTAILLLLSFTCMEKPVNPYIPGNAEADIYAGTEIDTATVFVSQSRLLRIGVKYFEWVDSFSVAVGSPLGVEVDPANAILDSTLRMVDLGSNIVDFQLRFPLGALGRQVLIIKTYRRGSAVPVVKRYQFRVNYDEHIDTVAPVFTRVLPEFKNKFHISYTPSCLLEVDVQDSLSPVLWCKINDREPASQSNPTKDPRFMKISQTILKTDLDLPRMVEISAVDDPVGSRNRNADSLWVYFAQNQPNTFKIKLASALLIKDTIKSPDSILTIHGFVVKPITESMNGLNFNVDVRKNGQSQGATTPISDNIFWFSRKIVLLDKSLHRLSCILSNPQGVKDSIVCYVKHIPVVTPLVVAVKDTADNTIPNWSAFEQGAIKVRLLVRPYTSPVTGVEVDGIPATKSNDSIYTTTLSLAHGWKYFSIRVTDALGAVGTSGINLCSNTRPMIDSTRWINPLPLNQLTSDVIYVQDADGDTLAMAASLIRNDQATLVGTDTIRPNEKSGSYSWRAAYTDTGSVSIAISLSDGRTTVSRSFKRVIRAKDIYFTMTNTSIADIADYYAPFICTLKTNTTANRRFVMLLDSTEIPEKIDLNGIVRWTPDARYSYGKHKITFVATALNSKDTLCDSIYLPPIMAEFQVGADSVVENETTPIRILLNRLVNFPTDESTLFKGSIQFAINHSNASDSDYIIVNPSKSHTLDLAGSISMVDITVRAVADSVAETNESVRFLLGDNNAPCMKIGDRKEFRLKIKDRTYRPESHEAQP